MQWSLALHPGAGDLIPGSGGVRKLRWKADGKGKRGGVRVIYYWRTRAGEILVADHLRQKRDKKHCRWGITSTETGD